MPTLSRGSVNDCVVPDSGNRLHCFMSGKEDIFRSQTLMANLG